MSAANSGGDIELLGQVNVTCKKEGKWFRIYVHIIM